MVMIKSANAKRPRFPVLHIDDLEIGDDPTWLIDGLMPASGFGIEKGRDNVEGATAAFACLGLSQGIERTTQHAVFQLQRAGFNGVAALSSVKTDTSVFGLAADFDFGFAMFVQYLTRNLSVSFIFFNFFLFASSNE